MTGPVRIGKLLPEVLANLGIETKPLLVQVWFDGACEPRNPGGVATCGWIVEAEGRALEHGCSVVANGGPNATNNFAEWCALGLALRWLVDNPPDSWGFDEPRAPITLEILGDSQLVVNQLVGSWKCNKPHLLALRDRCREHLQRVGLEWSARWIPREENERADALSRQAYIEKTGKPFPERIRR